MLQNFFILILGTLWIVLLVGAALWAITGALAASRVGMRPLYGALIGMVLPLVGVIGILVMGERRAVPASVSGPTAGWAAPMGAAGPNDAVSPARSLLDLNDPSWSTGLDQPPVLPVPLRKERRERTARSRSRSSGTNEQGTSSLLGNLGPSAASVVIAGLLVVSLVLPWFSITPANLLVGSFYGAESLLTVVPIACSAALIALVATQIHRHEGRWSVLLAAACAPWVVVAAEIALTSHTFARAGYLLKTGTSVRFHVSVVARLGSYVLLVAALGGLALAGRTALTTIRMRRPSRAQTGGEYA